MDLERPLLLSDGGGDRLALVRSLRGEGRRGEPTVDAEGAVHLEGDDDGGPEEPSSEEASLAAVCERHHELSLQALETPTDLGTAASLFSRVLRVVASRPLCGATVPLWVLSCVGPKARGPGGLASSARPFPLAWAESAAAALAVVALPLNLWVMALNSSWPPAYGACLREAVSAARSQARERSPPEEEDDKPGGRLEISRSETPSVDDDQRTPPDEQRLVRRPAGARALERAAACAAPLAALAFVGAIALYARDSRRLDCRVEYISYEDDVPHDDVPNDERIESSSKSSSESRTTVEYPWACTFASAAWLATRLVDAIAVPLALVLATMFYAHCRALSSALGEAAEAKRRAPSASPEDDELPRLIDDANSLWRWPLRSVVAIFSLVASLVIADALASLAGAPFLADLHGLSAVALATALAAPPLLLTAHVNRAIDDHDALRSFAHDALRFHRLPVLLVPFLLAAVLAAPHFL